MLSRKSIVVDKESIPINEWTSLIEENDIYHELGGDGDLKERMEALEEKTKTSK